MPAPKGNTYAEKWTPELVVRFFDSVKTKTGQTFHFGKAVAITLEEMASEIGTSRKTADNICGYLKEKFHDNPEVLGTIKSAEMEFEAHIVDQTMKGNAVPSMAIFQLKNKHGYKDRTETDITHKGNNITVNITDDIPGND